ncbi:MAG TPA: hypothetical protein VG916_16055, partial [Gemmatimonadaceae bacterium]|nr:hypothetical protein [Gemmatimonadaceae bacterium]
MRIARGSSIHGAARGVARRVARHAAAAAFVALGCLVAGAPVRAQSPTGNAYVDSAAVARAAWQRAVAAMQRHDTAGARAEVAHAAAAWPTQEAYVWGVAALAARAADTATLVRALRDYAALGLGRDLAHEPALNAYAGARFLAPLAALHDANRAPRGRDAVRATFGDTVFWPEGVDAAGAAGTFYVASVRHRTIAEVRVAPPAGDEAAAQGRARVRELLPRGTPGGGAILGVRADAARGVVWATTAG